MKVFFASDVHIGVLGYKTAEANELEERFINWLDMVKIEGETLYLLGDIFDFWFEYKHTIPKGCTSVLAKLRELVKSGVDIHYFCGNHDEWIQDYFTTYIGVIIHNKEPETIELQGKRFVMGHGHKLGLDKRFFARFMHVAFSNRPLYMFCEKMFLSDFFMSWGQNWSRSNMIKKRTQESMTFNPENNKLLTYLENFNQEKVDYFVFGHFHTPTIYPINNSNSSKLFILGEWLRNPQYAVLENGELDLLKLQ
ncbi:MAG: UDP-2,3-diacylglucosamine diphosphatase [Bacteroidetes bacterium]|nr:UDP-2,3-diacylglucosamine diphosphatase [Bacteroidota bacterium]